MKSLSTLLLILVFPIFIIAQNKIENSVDTLGNDSFLEGVSETIPDVNIFEDDTPLNITLKYDITSFIKNKQKGEFLDAELIIHLNDEQLFTKNIRLKARGNFRRGQCFFPPIQLNFKTDKLQNPELKGIKKIKVVTHCSKSKSNEIYILKEYLAYKLYNLLTDISFRVRLLNITYVDTGKKERNYQQYGFLIEPVELVAKRHESILIDPAVVRANNVIEADADRAALFQYMIGNTDWRIKGGHNTKYIKSLNLISSKVTPVPYDFDFSGFVGADYSFPQEWTSIENVTEREYMGYCRSVDEIYLKNIKQFTDKQNEIHRAIVDFEYLDERSKKTLTRFIEEFYLELERPDRFIVTLKNQCRSTNF